MAWTFDIEFRHVVPKRIQVLTRLATIKPPRNTVRMLTRKLFSGMRYTNASINQMRMMESAVTSEIFFET
ncbi:MAG: hypothetical protein A4E42_00201 [Methanoregulaceae archaeon PtaU1.Bin222]|nr:MAG: hypothetical protein A4E42_00201 [Methanoregulaceae archaeon PtaU1.Bin222]